MGVDADSFVGYGAFVEDITGVIHDGCAKNDDIFVWNDEEESITYDYDNAHRNDFIVITEPYGCYWTFIGVDFLAGTPEQTIENLQTVKQKWNALITNLISVIPDEHEDVKQKLLELEPSIIEEGYFS